MKNNFDDLLREKWEEKHFPVDELHRQQMLDLLNSQHRRKKGIFWWFGGMAFIAALPVIFLMIRSEEAVTVPQSPVPLNADKKPNEFVESREKTSEQNINTQANRSVNAVRNTESTSKILAKKAETFKSHSPNASKYSSIVGNENKNAANQSDLSNKPEIVSHRPEQGTKNINNNNNNISTLVPSESEQKPVLIPREETKVYAQPETPEEVKIAEPAQFSPVTLPLEANYFSRVESPPPGINGLVQSSFTNFHSVRVFGEFGAGLIPAVRQAFSSGWNVTAGAGISYRMGSKTNLLLSAGYLMQDGGFDFERTSTVQHTGFGTRSNFNTLTPDRLHFVYSRLGLQYETGRHLFSVFGGAQWVYGTQGTIVIRTTDQFAGTTESTQYTWLNTDGMQRLLWNGEALYGYRITSRTSIRAGMKYYFSSIEKSDPSLKAEGYTWNGDFSKITPSFIINYQLYGYR